MEFPALKIGKSKIVVQKRSMEEYFMVQEVVNNP